MKVVHVGPPRGRRGGPAGYLNQLALGAEAARAKAEGQDHAADRHRVVLPPPSAPAPNAPPHKPSLLDRAAGSVRRLLRSVTGGPKQYRPSPEELAAREGAVHRLLSETEIGQREEAAASREEALAGCDAAFCHDFFNAEAMLGSLPEGRQTWLFLHTPMPLALYLAWSWGVPEADWRELAALPDVLRWTEKEIEICRRAHRVILPCPEAAGELIRVHPGFEEALADADYLLTGAQGAGAQGAVGDSRSAEHEPVSRDEERRRWGIEPGEVAGLFLGNAEPYRGLDALLDTLPRLDAHGIPAGKILVAGPPAESLPEHPRLVPLGRVSDVASLLRAVDFVINVNRFCLFDLSTIEAVDAGKPLLLHAVGGNLTFRDLGAGARMIADLRPETVAAGLAEMFAMAEQERRELGRASRACYEAHLTPEAMWRRHLDLYDRAGLDSRSVNPVERPTDALLHRS